MKAVAIAAFRHGLWAGGFTMGSSINFVNALAAAIHGDAVFAVAAFILAMVMARMGWREWQLHRKGLANL